MMPQLPNLEALNFRNKDYESCSLHHERDSIVKTGCLDLEIQCESPV